MTAEQPEIGGGMQTRAVRVILMADTSYSMDGARMNALNTAMQEVIPVLRDSDDENSRGTIEIQALAFSTGARWVNPTPVNVQQYRWTDLEADGVTDGGHGQDRTDMGEGFALAAEALDEAKMDRNAFPPEGRPPVLILVTDGEPTDDYQAGLHKLNSQRWAQAAVRAAISVGTGTNENMLREFLGNIEFPLLTANNVDDLKRFVKYATVALSSASAQGVSKENDGGAGDGDTTLVIPPPPPSGPPDHVW